MELGQKIYNLRKEKGMTLEDLGERVGVGKSTVRKWEKGMIKNMRRDKLISLAEALGCSVPYLLDCEESKTFNNMSRTAEVLEESKLSGVSISDLLGVDYEITEKDCENTVRMYEAIKNSCERRGIKQNKRELLNAFAGEGKFAKISQDYFIFFDDGKEKMLIETILRDEEYHDRLIEYAKALLLMKEAKDKE